ncbi:28S ribosomal protein S6, mitochondrial [Chamberlinius hualienensis]
MPTYELTLIYKIVAQAELKTLIKRTAEAVFAEKGIIRKMENLGTRPLPYIMKKSSINHKQGCYFLMHFDCPTSSIVRLDDLFQRDTDILRKNFFAVHIPEEPITCSLSTEMLPPAYNPEVQRLLEVGRKKEPKRFKMNVEHYIF